MKQNYLKGLLAVLFTFCCTAVMAQHFEVDGIYYYVDDYSELDYKTVVVYAPEESPTIYTGNVVIPETVVYEGETYTVAQIGVSAFNGCTKLTGVSIPNTVTTIEHCAFKGCTSLQNIKIPKSVNYIANMAFDETGWYNKQPDGLLYLDGWLLGYKGEKPSSIEINADTRGIAHGAFAKCDELTHVTIPEGVTDICGEAFYLCNNLLSVELPGTLTTIGNSAFAGCENLSGITLPNGITHIYNQAFAGCTSLTNIKLPSTVQHLGASAFYDTGWYNEQPGPLIYLGDWLIHHKGDLRGEVTIVDGIKHIGTYALAYSEYLTGVVIPNSVENIESGAFCQTGIKTLTIPNSVKSVGTDAFEECTSLIDLNIGKGVEKIGKRGFKNCSSIVNLKIPGNIVSVGQDAFAGCKAVKDLYIEDSEHPLPFDNLNFFDGYSGAEASIETLYLGRDLYSSSQYEEKLSLPKSLKSLTISDGVTRLDNYRFNNRNLESIIVTEGNKYYDSRKECNAIIETSSNKLLFGCKNSTIPYGVATIGEEAFESSYGLKNIGIPGSVITIEDYAFAECLDLENIVISNSVTKLGEAVFVECESLKSVTIGNGIKEIPMGTFYYCDALESIYLVSETPPAVVNEYNFNEEQYKTVDLYVPNGTMAAYKEADVWKEFLNIKEFDATGINTAIINNKKNQKVYDLLGKKVTSPLKGLYIIDGKKILKK